MSTTKAPRGKRTGVNAGEESRGTVGTATRALARNVSGWSVTLFVVKSDTLKMTAAPVADESGRYTHVIS